MSCRPQDETLVSMFVRRATEDSDRVALLLPDGNGTDFQEVTWSRIASDAGRVAVQLERHGVEPGDRVVLISGNCYEWILCDLGVMMARAVHVPVHESLAGDQILQQVHDCGAAVIVAADDRQVQKLVPLADRLSPDVRIFTLQPCEQPMRENVPLQSLFHPLPDVEDAEIRRLHDEVLGTVRPGDLATILYTSGTDGQPKGVMLSHANLVFNTRATLAAVNCDTGDLRLSFLPWSHIFARTCELYTWLECGLTMAIAQGRDRIMANCGTLHPTLINAVPHFYEGLYRSLEQHGMLNAPGSLRQLLGGHIRLCCSGGAAIPRHVTEMFARQHVQLLQGYGLTETSPVISTCTPQANKIGTVGRPLKGVEVRIADDGEVLTRGPHVMLGYYNRPDATAVAIRDGWFHTGDLGELDNEGYLRITGRKKDLIVLATGKKIVPTTVEMRLTQDPLIRQAIVVGDGRKYLAALIVPDGDALEIEMSGHGLAGLTIDELIRRPEVRTLYDDRVKQRLVSLSEVEQVRRFELLRHGFTIENGELTPTLKLRRDPIMKNRAEVIDSLYNDVASLRSAGTKP